MRKRLLSCPFHLRRISGACRLIPRARDSRARLLISTQISTLITCSSLQHNRNGKMQQVGVSSEKAVCQSFSCVLLAPRNRLRLLQSPRLQGFMFLLAKMTAGDSLRVSSKQFICVSVYFTDFMLRESKVTNIGTTTKLN